MPKGAMEPTGLIVDTVTKGKKAATVDAGLIQPVVEETTDKVAETMEAEGKAPATEIQNEDSHRTAFSSSMCSQEL
ncbi:hypothetical protein ON010_g5397 [Phytophthora cinnamomi]|nr:hypothetical protein ON010_g5397 [Phytophthora cinnamomi]